MRRVKVETIEVGGREVLRFTAPTGHAIGVARSVADVAALLAGAGFDVVEIDLDTPPPAY